MSESCRCLRQAKNEGDFTDWKLIGAEASSRWPGLTKLHAFSLLLTRALGTCADMLLLLCIRFGFAAFQALRGDWKGGFGELRERVWETCCNRRCYRSESGLFSRAILVPWLKTFLVIIYWSFLYVLCTITLTC